MNSLFASMARGLEELLKTEPENLDALECQVVQGGIHFRDDTRPVYQSLTWNRLASRIILPIGECKVYNDLDLYLGVQAVDRTEIFNPGATSAVHFSGLNETIHNSQCGALKVKGVIVDAFTRKNMPRPDVDRKSPDPRINVWLNKDTISIVLDLSGDDLYQRSYRDRAGQAPIRETLAAAIIMRSGWQPGTPLLGPMCGSDTLLIEATMRTIDRAPDLHRGYWGLSGWAQYSETIRQEIKAEVQVHTCKGLADYTSHFYGPDNGARVIEKVRNNARRADIADLTTFDVEDVARPGNPLPKGPYGMVISNPPYGERLDSEPVLIALHSLLGHTMKNQFGGWNSSLFSASPDLFSSLQLRADKQFKAKDGPLDCVQKNYYVAETTADSKSAMIAEDYANRPRKNIKKLEKWTRQEGVECYRLCDTDPPEYNVAADRYGDWVVVQEYVPSKMVDAQKARQRSFDIIAATPSALEITPDKLVLKTRERQKGKNQYQKVNEKGEFIEVSEYNARLWANLTDYLDTGLFLDHRTACHMLGQMSKGKDFLDPLSYADSASVHVGLGGTRSTTTVDISRTYLRQAERNLHLNGLGGRAHRLIQADCPDWLCDANEQLDPIFIDPPTSSNSKRMKGSFDVQCDHLVLMKDLKRLLRKDGTITFSSNKRGFRMDLDGLAELGLKAQEITQETLSQDSARNRQIHNCWLITAA